MNVEQLPRDARVKLEGLRHRYDTRRALLDGTLASLRDCIARCNRLENLLGTTSDETAAKEYETKLEVAREEHTRLLQLRQQYDIEQRSAANDATRCDDWVLQLSGDTRLRSTPKRSTPYSADKLAQVRADIGKLEAESQQIETALLDRKSLERAVDDHVSQLATSCRPQFRGETGHEPFRVEFSAHLGGLHVPKPLELLAWWDARGLAERLKALLPDQAGYSLAEKAEARERIGARLLSAERAEEALIEAAEAGGLFIARRPYADPLAVLGLSVFKAEAAAA